MVFIVSALVDLLIIVPGYASERKKSMKIRPKTICLEILSSALQKCYNALESKSGGFF